MSLADESDPFGNELRYPDGRAWSGGAVASVVAPMAAAVTAAMGRRIPQRFFWLSRLFWLTFWSRTPNLTPARFNPRRKAVPQPSAMISNALTSPAYAYSPDADRVCPAASARLLYGLVRFLVLLAFLVREYWLAIRQCRTGTLPSSGYNRADLPPRSAQQPPASHGSAFGNAIAWACRRYGSASGHKGWLGPSRAVVAFGSGNKGFRPATTSFADRANVTFGGTTKRFRRRLPACGRQSWQNSNILPGPIGDTVANPAAPILAQPQSRQKIADAPLQRQRIADRAPAWPVARVPAIRALAEMFPIGDQYRSAGRAAAIPGGQFRYV